MANRAYLYAASREPVGEWEYPNDGEYFDSRWTIPLAWWLLFSSEDFRMIDDSLYGGDVWSRL
ncbi:MAG: hypothetical protein AAFN70_20790, partial [Planctomycetota bacterium]